MSNFENNGVTQLGIELLAKVQSGEKLKFTKIALGSGIIPPGKEPKDMVGLVKPVVDLAISRLINNGETVTVGSTFNNKDVATAFYYRELGLFANDPDIGEILYCYGNAGETADLVPPGNSANAIEKIIDIIVSIGNAEVIANIASGIYARKEEVDAINNRLSNGIVISVNNKQGNVNLGASDVGASPVNHASNTATYGISTVNNYGHAKASNQVPLVAGTASVGTDNGEFASGDHVHPAQTTISGNAGSATKLQTARQINGVAFDGTKNITITASPNSHNHNASDINAGTIPTARLPIASTTQQGIVLLNNTVTSTSTSTALTANIGKTIYDQLQTAQMHKLTTDEGLTHPISNSGDLNNIIKTGFYEVVKSMGNSPEIKGTGVMLVIGITPNYEDPRITQHIIDDYGNTFIRYRQSGNWTSWKTINDYLPDWQKWSNASLNSGWYDGYGGVRYYVDELKFVHLALDIYKDAPNEQADLTIAKIPDSLTPKKPVSFFLFSETNYALCAVGGTINIIEEFRGTLPNYKRYWGYVSWKI